MPPLLPPPDRVIPVLVGAKGPRMLRLTARYADAWNTAWYGRPNDRLKTQVADLDAALHAEGRDPATVRRTVGLYVRSGEPPGAPSDDRSLLSSSDVARAIDQYDRLGFDDVVEAEPVVLV